MQRPGGRTVFGKEYSCSWNRVNEGENGRRWDQRISEGQIIVKRLNFALSGMGNCCRFFKEEYPSITYFS